MAAGGEGVLPPRRGVAGRRRRAWSAIAVRSCTPARPGDRPGARPRPGEPLAVRRHPGPRPRDDLLAVAADDEAGPARRAAAHRARPRSGARDPGGQRREVPVRLRLPAGHHPAPAACRPGTTPSSSTARRRRRRAQDPRGPRRQPAVGQADLRPRRTHRAAARRGRRRGPVQPAVQASAHARQSRGRGAGRGPGPLPVGARSSSARPGRSPRNGPTAGSAHALPR